MQQVDKKLFARYAIRETMGLVSLAAALFISAGRLDWWQAWVCLAVMLAWITATALVILHSNPALLAERLGPRKDSKPWDIAIMSILGLAQLARYILAGLDRRFGWSGGFSLSIQVTAGIICLLGYALVVWATASNAYFSQIVRLQPERGQTVVSGGPYRWVRHPAYIGGILYELAVPLLLTSWPTLCISGLTVALLILRTSLEDRTLQAELDGYKDYTKRVRSRLLPGIW